MKKRYASLDVLRGLTVAFMCIVNNPGTWSHIFSPLRHAPWNGCTPTDLVFPTFVFCMGCAMAFSFEGRNTGTAKDYLRVLKRGALIFLTGLALNLYPFFPTEPHDPSASFGSNWLWWLEHKRIFGVLQRIGLSYILAGCVALWLRKPGKIMSAIGVLCVTSTGILHPGGECFSPMGQMADRQQPLLPRLQRHGLRSRRASGNDDDSLHLPSGLSRRVDDNPLQKPAGARWRQP